MSEAEFNAPTRADLKRGFVEKFGAPGLANWGPRMRWNFGYFTPDDHYETLLKSMVNPNTSWLDIGCGRLLLQSNDALAKVLSDKCNYLHGVDPDDTIRENQAVHEYSQCAIEDFNTDRRFDLVTLRMVAEHVQDPDELVNKIDEVVRPGARIIIYTIYKWSPVPVFTWITPFRLHHVAKRVLWGTEEKDTFPVAYKMNTRSELRELMNQRGFREVLFTYLDDCRTLGRIRFGQWLELTAWRILNRLGLHYPEVCILGVYQKCIDDHAK